MPHRSYWINKDNAAFIEQNRGGMTPNKVINILIRQAREADPSGQYLKSLLASYD